MGHWKNGWIQTPQQILMDSCIKQAPVLKKRFWIIPWPLAYYRLDWIRKIINFWYTFGWKWWVSSFRDYLGLSNACSYDVDDVIGRVDRFGFQNFCSPDVPYVFMEKYGKWFLNEPHREKTCLCHMQTTKAQISLRIRAVWSAPLLFPA